IARRTEDVWRRFPAVIAAYLFGSVARGAATSTSDLDLAVVVKEGERMDRAALASALVESLGTDLLDIVVLNLAGLTLTHRALRDGRLIYCSDDRQRLEFTRRRLLEYFDAEPLRR